MTSKPGLARRAAARLKLLARGAVRRAFRPFLARHLDLLHQVARRLEHVEALQVNLREAAQTGLALGWDHVALTRRLAALEDRVEALTAQLEARDVQADAHESAEDASTVPLNSARLGHAHEPMKTRVG